MSKRKTMDKAQARERRNQLLESAASAKLSLTEGVREMRAISGMTQEEFAQHRGVSARVIKAIELEQGNPTVATLNRIGEFFGLEVGFVPVRRKVSTGGDNAISETQANAEAAQADQTVTMDRASWEAAMRKQLQEAFQLAIDQASARFFPNLPPADAPVITKVSVSTRKTKKPSPQ
jgi:DNA-binding XRE family transcriptional regulator